MFTTLWRMALAVLVAGVSMVLTPQTSEAQWRMGGRSRGYGGNYNEGSYYPNYEYRGSGYAEPQYSYYSDGYAPSTAQTGNPCGDAASGYASSASQYSFYPDNQRSNPNAAGFVVRVPDPNAEIWFQDHKTQQRGMVRQFESDGVHPNQPATFQVRARWMQNGQPMDQTRQVQARAGQTVNVDFTSPQREQIPVNPQGQQPSTQQQQNQRPSQQQQGQPPTQQQQNQRPAQKQ